MKNGDLVVTPSPDGSLKLLNYCKDIDKNIIK